jgi:hypothetical protein
MVAGLTVRRKAMKMRSLGVLSVAAALVVAGLATVGTGAAHAADLGVQQAPARLTGPAERYSLTLDDFGRGGGAYTTLDNDSYWDGRGHLFGFRREDAADFMGNPWGGYLAGGVVIAPDVATAERDLDQAAQDWTKDWKDAAPLDMPAVGDRMVAVSRLSPWEIAQDQPMTEVFVAFRQGNASAHFMFATMPGFDPAAQASRYAEVLLSHLQG